VNIIQISEQLKDVPDQFLMQEIQNPTGSYPSYLVVSELTRRKRMRDGVMKQEPTTSVAEDLVGISSTPEAAQSTLGAAQQMMAQPQQMPPQMPQQMPPQMPPHAMPQQMPQQMPQMMGGGGLVAFENGGPIRAQEGLFADLRRYVLPYEDEERRAALDESVSGIGQSILGATSEIPFPRFTPLGADPESSPFGNFVRGRLSPTEDAAYVPPSNYAPPSQKPVISLQSLGLGNKKSETDIMLEMMAQQQAERDRQAPKPKSPVATGASAQQKMAGEGAPPPRAGGLGAYQMPDYLTKAFDKALTPINRLTETQLEERGKAGIKEFEERMPDRESKILEKRILERTEQLQKDKDMSFNEALFAAGAAILSAPGGGGMKWAGEGLKAFGQTMVEGKKDIRRGEDLLQQSELELIRSQTLRDQGKYAASEKAKQKSLDMEERGMRFAQSDAALNLKRAEMDINFAKLSSEIGAKEAEAFYKNAYGKLLQQGGPGALTAAAKAAATPPSRGG
jgi:hypothetical protein